ncbi:MAG: SGNH/GDSL hydrolase family protein [Bacteroidales bacterium]|nr:SGNH/GDSL hydrolase family protein [Bacteroidales bacterium]
MNRRRQRRYPYLRLWLLLTVALALFVLFSFAEEEIKIGEKSLKKAPFAETILKSDSEAEDSVFLAKESKDEDVAIVNQTDSTAQTLFIFGDSMTMHLAERLAAYARQNGHTVYAVNWDSSNTKTWAECDTLDYYMRLYKPTQVFIALGANELYLRTPEIRLPQIRAIVEKIGDVPFVWIGPPSLKMDGGLNDILEKNLPKGSFFRSSELQLARKKDHIHPTKQASAQWMDSVMKWIPDSRHPFLADFPADSVANARPNLKFLKARNK